MDSSVSARLQEGKRRAAEERERRAEEQRLEDEAREAAEADELALMRRHHELSSYASGVYAEVEKLFSKRPMEMVGQITVEHANRAIRDVRDLIAGENDVYFDEIKEIVDSGDLPRVHDVLVRLRIVKDALARMDARHSRDWHPKPSSSFDHLSIIGR